MLDMTRYYHNNNIPATRFVQNRKVCFCSENVTFVQWRKCWFLTVNIILIVFLKNAMGSHTCQEHLAQRYFFNCSKFSVHSRKVVKSVMRGTMGHSIEFHSNSLKFTPTPSQPDTLCVYFTWTVKQNAFVKRKHILHTWWTSKYFTSSPLQILGAPLVEIMSGQYFYTFNDGEWYSYTKITPSTSGSSGWPFGDNWNSSAGDPWCPTRWPMVPRIRGTLGQLTHCHFSDIGAEPKRDTPKLSTGHLKLIVHWTSWESINLKLPKLCPLETNYQKMTQGAPSSPTPLSLSESHRFTS